MIEINLSGPDGNAFALLGMVRTWGRQLELDTTDVRAEMKSGDYDNLVKVMTRWCDEHNIEVELIDSGEEDWE